MPAEAGAQQLGQRVPLYDDAKQTKTFENIVTLNYEFQDPANVHDGGVMLCSTPTKSSLHQEDDDVLGNKKEEGGRGGGAPGNSCAPFFAPK